MLEILKGVAIVVGALSMLVVIHEFGHFLPARLFGMRVSKFFLFFDWPIKLFSFKKGETEYGVGVLPLGGYVKIEGMIDESLDKEHLQREPEPWEFRAKPVWQKFIVMIGGVTMNVILAIGLFTAVFMVWGQSHTPITALKYGLYVTPGSAAEKLGLKPGDVPLALNGQPLQYLEDLASAEVLLGTDVTLTVKRGADTVTLGVPNDFLNTLDEEEAGGLFLPNAPPIVQRTPALADNDLPVNQVDLQTGDVLLALDDRPIPTFAHIHYALQDKAAGDTLTLVVDRAQGGRDTLHPVLGERRILGIAPQQTYLVGQQQQTYPGLGEALSLGTGKAFGIVETNSRGFGKMASGEVDVSKSLAGPFKIFAMLLAMVEETGWYGFWTFTAMLSMILAVVNLLPIPALDGGHLVFLLIEAVRGKEPSTKVRLIAQQIGMLLLLLLMVFVLFNDLRSLFF